MSSPPRASTSVIVAGIAAIISAGFVLASVSLGFFGLLLGSTRTSFSALPPAALYVALGFCAFMACLSLFGIATGIGLIFSRKWARISVLVWGGLAVFFSVFGIIFAFLTPLPVTPGAVELPAGTMHTVRIFLLCFYGVPAAIGTWWLILFNRKSVAAQFAGTADPGSAQKPRPPIPVTVLAWLYITSAAHILILPFLPFSMPLILFGHLFSGRISSLAYVFICLVFAVSGIGLLKLKLWSYPLTIGLQLFFLASAIVTVLNPNYPSQVASLMDHVNSAMGLPADLYNPLNNLHQARWSMYAGLLIPFAMVAILIYYRRRFVEAATSGTSPS
jgi:hypothetical protein